MQVYRFVDMGFLFGKSRKVSGDVLLLDLFAMMAFVVETA
jgi:hypothetical protein